MGEFFKAVIEGRYILGAAYFSDERADKIAERLRPIVAQCLDDAELKEAVDDLAAETLGKCGSIPKFNWAQRLTSVLIDAALQGAVTVHSASLSTLRWLHWYQPLATFHGQRLHRVAGMANRRPASIRLARPNKVNICGAAPQVGSTPTKSRIA